LAEEITIPFLANIDKASAPNAPTRQTLTWLAQRDGKVVYMDFIFYPTMETLRVYAKLWDGSEERDIIHFATGSLTYIALHDASIRIHCNKDFRAGDEIRITGENWDTADPHRMRVFATVELY